MIRRARRLARIVAWPLSLLALGAAPACTRAAPATAPNAARDLHLPPQAAEITAARGLDFRRPVAVNDVTRARFRHVLRDVLAAHPIDEGYGAFERAFGFVPLDTQLSRDATVRAQVEQLLGLYVPRDRAIFLRPRGDAPKPESADEVLVHELVHAAQDDRYGMAAYEDDAPPDDEQLARRAVYEGDATVATWVVLGARAGKPRDDVLEDHEYQAKLQSMLAGSAQELEASAAASTALARATTYFPYTAGAFFVAEAMRAGGPELVGRLYERLPTTTEQVLHPDKYFAGEGAAPVDPPAAPPGWRVITRGRMGELRTRVLLESTLSAPRAIAASTGWGGDAYAVVQRDGDDRLAVLWSTTWDDEEAATRFAAALGEATRCSGGARACPLGAVAMKRDHERVAWVRGLDDGDAQIDRLLTLPKRAPKAVPPLGAITLRKRGEDDDDVPLPLDTPVVTVASLGARAVISPELVLRRPGRSLDMLVDARDGHGRGSLSHLEGPLDDAKEKALRVAFAATWASTLALEDEPTADVELPIGRGRELRWRIDGGKGTIRVALVPTCGGAELLMVTRLARGEAARITLARWARSIERISDAAPPMCGGVASRTTRR